jgi:hypothetical protein
MRKPSNPRAERAWRVWTISPRLPTFALAAGGMALLLLAAGCLSAGWPGPAPGPESGPASGPDPVAPCEGGAAYWSRVSSYAGALGQTVSATIGQCDAGTSTLYVYVDCCFGAASHLQRLQPDGTWTDVWPAVDCACAEVPSPLEVAPGAEVTFPAQPLETPPPEGATYRWVFLVGWCADWSCATELDSPAFFFSAEG